MVEMDDLGSGGLLQDELVVGEGLVQAGLQNCERDVIFLFRPFDLDLRREVQAVVIVVLGIAGVGDQGPQFIVDELAVGMQIGSAEDDFPRQPAVITMAADYVNYIIGLLTLVPFFVGNRFRSIFQDRGFSGSYLVQQQRIVNNLRTEVFERLAGVGRDNVIAANHEAVLGGNPQLEVVAVTDHVKRAIADNGEQSD